MAELSDKLEFTGERFTPECVREIWYEHMHRYAFASEFTAGKKILDAACGEGFGSFLLADKAQSVVGVDISKQAVSHATKRYLANNLSYQIADCQDLPFDDDSFDCIVSFETLEHLEQQSEMLAEFRRVLSKKGFLMISSPDKAVYTDEMKNDNPFHLRELYRPELESLLSSEFPAVKLLGHKLAFHSMIWAVDGHDSEMNPGKNETMMVLQTEQKGKINRVAPDHKAVYFVAICAAESELLPCIENRVFLFDDEAESVYQHYHHEIRTNMKAGAMLQARDQEIEDLKAALELTVRVQNAPWWRRFFAGK